jgi:hypothetical protein
METRATAAETARDAALLRVADLGRRVTAAEAKVHAAQRFAVDAAVVAAATAAQVTTAAASKYNRLMGEYNVVRSKLKEANEKTLALSYSRVTERFGDNLFASLQHNASERDKGTLLEAITEYRHGAFVSGHRSAQGDPPVPDASSSSSGKPSASSSSSPPPGASSSSSGKPSASSSSPPPYASSSSSGKPSASSSSPPPNASSSSSGKPSASTVRSFLSYVQTSLIMARRQKTNANIFDPLLDDKVEMRHLNKALANIMVACLSFVDRKFVSVVSYATLLNVLTQTHSPLAVDMVNDAISGGVTPQTLYKHVYKIVDAELAKDVYFNPRATLIGAYDNNSRNYSINAARSGLDACNRPLIWTNMEAFIYFAFWFYEQKLRTGELSKRSVQFNLKLAPGYNGEDKKWKSITSCPVSLLDLGNDYCEKCEEAQPVGDKVSDASFLKEEVLGSMIWVTEQHFFDDKHYFAFYGPNRATAKLRPVLLKKESPIQQESATPKVCLWCKTMNGKQRGKCFGCERALRTMDEIRVDLKGADALKSIFKPRPLRVNRRLYDIVSFIDSKGELRHQKISLDPNTLSCIEEGDDESKDLTSNSDPAVEVHRRLLASMALNPGSKAAIKQIYDKWGAIFKLQGFVDNEIQDKTLSIDEVRAWVFLVADLGATAFDVLDGEDKYRNIIHVLGLFHECKSWLEVVLDLLFSIGGGFLAAFHTFETEGAQSFLRRAGDIHKANDFPRDVCKPALYTAFVKEYLLRKLDQDPAYDCETFDINEAYVWALAELEKETCKDEKFKNVIHFLFRILPAYELIKKGVRTGNIAAYNCGRRVLISYAFALGKVKYAPAVVRDMIQYYHKMPVELRREMNVIFGLYDEGINGKLEESNKLQKGMVIADTMRGIQAGAVMAGISPTLSSAQHNFSASPRKPRDTAARVPTNLDRDIVLCSAYLIQNKSCQLKDDEIVRPMMFDGVTPTVPGMDLIRLGIYGKSLQDIWIADYIATSKAPKMKAGKSFRPRKTRGKHGKAGDVIPAGADSHVDAEELDCDEEVETNTGAPAKVPDEPIGATIDEYEEDTIDSEK